MTIVSQRSIKVFRSFCKRTDAATAVEFGIILFPLIILILATILVGMTFVFSSTLDYAVKQAARQVMTGAAQYNQMSATQFATNVFCPNLPTFLKCANVTINIQTEKTKNTDGTYSLDNTGYYDLVNASQTALLTSAYTNSGSAQFCTGLPGDYVYIQVMYPMPVLFYFIMPQGALTKANGQTVFLLMATAAFKNEQFPTSASTPC